MKEANCLKYSIGNHIMCSSYHLIVFLSVYFLTTCMNIIHYELNNMDDKKYTMIKYRIIEKEKNIYLIKYNKI